MEGFKTTVLCVSELLGEGMKRIHNDESVSSLFKIDNGKGLNMAKQVKLTAAASGQRLAVQPFANSKRVDSLPAIVYGGEGQAPTTSSLRVATSA